MAESFLQPETQQENGKYFFQLLEDNPCTSCSAPCCKMLLLPYQAPNTFMEMDYIRYSLGFHGIRMLLYKDGMWQIQVEQTCRHLITETNRCSVHNTPKQPKTCSFFNPHQCFYKRNFTGSQSPDLLKINLERFEILLNHVVFDEEGKITQIPSFETMEALFEKIPA